MCKARRTMLAVLAAVVAVVVGSGTALALNVNCPNRTDGTCVGTSGADVMTGTDARDRIFAQAGADTLRGRGGDDDLAGMAGKDTSEGGAGNDWYLFGEAGWGVDSLVDTQGTWNSSTGDFGNLVYFFPEANNGAITINLTPTTGPEVKKGTNTVNWNDTVISSVFLGGTNGGDRVTGNTGRNWLGATSGGTTISAAGGNDQVEVNAGGAADTVNCGPGTQDVVFYDAGVDTVTGCEIRNPSTSSSSVAGSVAQPQP